MNALEDKQRLIEALREFETLMVATNAPSGIMHADGGRRGRRRG